MESFSILLLYRQYLSTIMKTTLEEAQLVLCQLRSVTKAYKRACSQVVLLNNKIESAKTRRNRAISMKRLSSAKCMEWNQMEQVRNLIFAHASAKCEQIESLQAKLEEITGGAREFILANCSK